MPSSPNPAGRKVLILSASAGTGHMRAAEALEKVFRQQPGVGEVRNIDALRFTNRLFRDFYSKLYIQLVQKAPTILGIVYNSTDEPWKTDRMRLMLDRLNTGPLERFIAKFKPDITVCTHFLPSEIISYLISKGKLDARLSIVVTDMDVHAMWLCRTFHRYFVALEESKVHLEVLGLPGDHITVSGIPIDPVFSEKNDRAAMRAEAGFDMDRPLFLISGGALGVSPAAGVLEGLSRLKHRAQAVVICGKNTEMQAEMEKQARAVEAKNPGLKFKILGYTNEMHRWMQMSDLFIGKPGGLTTAECLASGLPMIIVAPIPGQEDRNSDHLLEKGIALKCNEFTTLAYKIDGLLDHPEMLQSMKEKALWYGRPHAAATIVDTLLNQPVGAAAKVTPA
jgi:processive 1,2-diacylglycerol beta-glucosyltransferase